MQYQTDLNIVLVGHGLTKPTIKFGNDLNKLTEIKNLDSYTINQSLNLEKGLHKFFIDFDNKTNDTPDMAVEIVSVSFENFTLDRFKWSSKYYPRYPEPWRSQQTEPLPLYQTSATYLGWNGVWQLEFEVPIFTWIHQLENLGWIYP